MELGFCNDRAVYAILSNGGKVSAAHKARYDKMLADIKASLSDKSFSSTDTYGTLYADRENGFYLQLPQSWKGKYVAGGIADDCTAFIYTGPSKAQEEGFPETQNLLFRLYAVDAQRYAAKPPKGEPLVLGTFRGKMVYIGFPNGKTEGTQSASAYCEMLADAKRLDKNAVCTGSEQSASPLKTTVTFTARPATQKELEEDIGASSITDPKPEDFLYLSLSVNVSGKKSVDGTNIAVPDFLTEIPTSLQSENIRFWSGSRGYQDNADEDTAVYHCNLCLYRRGATDAVVRKAFVGHSVTVRYRIKGSSTGELTRTYPLNQILTFQ